MSVVDVDPWVANASRSKLRAQSGPAIGLGLALLSAQTCPAPPVEVGVEGWQWVSKSLKKLASLLLMPVVSEAEFWASDMPMCGATSAAQGGRARRIGDAPLPCWT